MTSSQNTAMDVDSPTGTLKRCSSAPMINENSTTGMTTSPPASTSSRETGTINLLGSNNQSRPRRFSASSSPLSAGSPKTTPRISQLKLEECVDVNNSRELAHEREIHHTMQISQSWEDLRLVSDNQKPNNKMSPLQLNLPTFGNYCTSPSPSRQTYCSSPGILSPTRTSLTRRSASPVLRPSTLGAKRKLDDKLDDNHFQCSPRAKRVSYGTDRGSGGLLTTSSPLPGSLSSIGTPESISSADSPSFQFRMIDSPSPSRPGVEPMAVSKQDHEMSEPPS